MLTKLSNARMALIWGDLRNLTDINELDIPTDLRIVGISNGEFPIDAHYPIPFLKSEKREFSNLAARKGWMLDKSWKDTYDQPSIQAREYHLPIYHHNQSAYYSKLQEDLHNLRSIWDDSMIPENIPFIAVAAKVIGNYCDEREAQYAEVVLIWSSGISKTFSLQWFEGPLEDCISSEYYVKSSNLISMRKGLLEFRHSSLAFSNLENPVWSIFVTPQFLGKNLSLGMPESQEKKNWPIEWKYNTRALFEEDANRLIDEICDVFSRENESAAYPIPLSNT